MSAIADVAELDGEGTGDAEAAVVGLVVADVADALGAGEALSVGVAVGVAALVGALVGADVPALVGARFNVTSPPLQPAMASALASRTHPAGIGVVMRRVKDVIK